MPFSKVALILLTLVSHQFSIVQPRIASKDEEERGAGGKDISAVERLANAAVLSQRIIVGSVLLCEAAVSYAMYDPSSPCSRLILDILCPDQCASLPVYSSPLFLAGVASTVAGSLLRVLCFRALGRFFTYTLAIHDKHKLMTTGPYAVVRHPSYTGIALIISGITMCAASAGSWWREAGMWTLLGRVVTVWWAAVSTYASLIILRAPKEDEMLRLEFGEIWEEYARKVPYCYVPGIF